MAEYRHGQGPSRRIAGLAACVWFAAAPALAQDAAGLCAPRAGEIAGGASVLDCPGGLTITAEAGAVFALADAGGDGVPESAELSSGALLLEGPAFEVSTPEAIAAVRGTVWAVDAAPGKTSVFVETGSVAVARRSDAGGSVRLSDGEGVDVGAGAEPLAVRRWGAARVSALLARLGRP